VSRNPRPQSPSNAPEGKNCRVPGSREVTFPARGKGKTFSGGGELTQRESPGSRSYNGKSVRGGNDAHHFRKGGNRVVEQFQVENVDQRWQKEGMRKGLHKPCGWVKGGHRQQPTGLSDHFQKKKKNIRFGRKNSGVLFAVRIPQRTTSQRRRREKGEKIKPFKY